MLRLRPNNYSFSPMQTGMEGFSVKAILLLTDFSEDTELFRIPNVLSVRLRQHDLWDIRRQNYPAGKMPDGRVPVLEAALQLHLPEGSTPVREGQPAVQEMVVGLPLAVLPEPWGKHELVVNFTGCSWDIFVDGHLFDRDYALGYPSSVRGELLEKRNAAVEKMEFYKPCLMPKLAKEKKPRRVPVQYFTPSGHNAWVGDVATIWHRGRYHLFYLLDRRGHESKFGTGGHYFEHISTTDFKHWTEHQPAVPIEEQWETIGTGTPFVWNDTLYISYGMHTSRIWPEQRTSAPIQRDSIHDNGYSCAIPFHQLHDIYPSGASYSVSTNGVDDFHKSHILIHPAENPTIYTDHDGRLLMLANYGARGLWTSDRLDGGWHCLNEEFPPGGDCTFIFRWGDYEYIVGGFTGMWMKQAGSQTEGYTDMVKRGEDLYDGLSVPSICELPDGRHLMAGWVEMNRHWGGPLVIRELIQYPDGRIGAKFMDELIPPSRPIPERENNSLSPHKSYMLTFNVLPEKAGGHIRVQLSSKQTRQACIWTLDTSQRTARFGQGKSLRNGGQPQHATDFAIENLRGTELPFTVRMIILNNPKFGGSLIDVEIAGQRTMISHREGLDVDAFHVSEQGLTVRNLKVREVETK